jgi:ABC-2 type transport system permease protein
MNVRSLLRSELFKIRKRPQTWMMIALLVLFEIALYAGLVIANFVRDDPTSVQRNIQLGRLWEIGLIPTALASSIMAVVFASSLMGNEYSWTTIRPLVARSRSRSTLLSAKLVTVTLYTVVLVGAGVLSAVLSSIVGSAVVGIDSGLSTGRIVDIAATIGRYGLGVLPYAVMAFMFAVITRSNTAGIVLGIALQLLEDVIFSLLGAISDVFETIQKGGLSWNANRLMDFGGDSDVTTRNATISLAVMLVYIAVFALIAFRIFNRRDVTTS